MTLELTTRLHEIHVIVLSMSKTMTSSKGNEMIELQIDITSLEDVRATRNVIVAKSIVAAAIGVFDAGGRVVLKRSFCNAPNEMFRVFEDAEAFKNYWDGEWRLE